VQNGRSVAGFAVVVALALAPQSRGLAASAQSFDGTWNVEVDCPDVGDVRGYNWRFPAQVTSGYLTGSYHSPTNDAMGELSGRIRPDGQALLTLSEGPGQSPWRSAIPGPERLSAIPRTSASPGAAASANATKAGRAL